MLLNLQQNPLFFTFLLTFIIWSCWTLDGVVADPQLSYVKSGCSSYNVSDVTIFNENINATMRSLREQVSNKSKHTATAQGVKGNFPAFGVFQCRNYLSIKDCLACFDFAAVRIYDNCSVASTGARLIYEGCFLRLELGKRNGNEIGYREVEGSGLHQFRFPRIPIQPKGPEFQFHPYHDGIARLPGILTTALSLSHHGMPPLHFTVNCLPNHPSRWPNAVSATAALPPALKISTTTTLPPAF